MRNLEEILNSVQEELEGTIVPDTPFTLMDYAHGRCHLFAQALNLELGYEMEFLWDNDFWFEDAEYPSTVLVHAYCILSNGKLIDSRGEVSKEMIEYEYEANSFCYEKTTLEQLNTLIKTNSLEKSFTGEIKALRKFIRENISKYQ